MLVRNTEIRSLLMLSVVFFCFQVPLHCTTRKVDNGTRVPVNGECQVTHVYESVGYTNPRGLKTRQNNIRWLENGNESQNEFFLNFRKNLVRT